ncbi:putative ribonuclease H-like domain-containing protein [Tanacetum coccineum]|uniref:Ribonuclease H-like domain-containing protein n=1 Tax=Tanacetum coccineum TaxID=301880 RepID=A0ABQ5DJR0_9ASTR
MGDLHRFNQDSRFEIRDLRVEISMVNCCPSRSESDEDPKIMHKPLRIVDLDDGGKESLDGAELVRQVIRTRADTMSGDYGDERYYRSQPKFETTREQVKPRETHNLLQIYLLEDVDSESAHMVVASKVPMLKLGEENGNTAPKTTVVEGVEKIIPPTTAKEKAQKRLEVKARSTLMMGVPNEHQLKFNSIKDAKLLLEAIEKRFGGNAATKKTQRNLLKQQYENFTAPSSKTLDQTFDRLQKLMSQVEILGETLSQEDVNQKLLRSLSPESNTHVVVWRNKPELEIMSMDDLYNNLKVYEPEVKGTSSLSTSTQNMAFVSSNNSGSTNEAVNTAHGVSVASTQANATNLINIDNLSDAVICAFFVSQPSSPQLANEDLQQLHPDDLEEMDLRWQMAMLTIWAIRFLKNTGRKVTINGNETIRFDKSKVECYNYHKMGHFVESAEFQETKTTGIRKASRRSVPVETTTSNDLISCDGLGGSDSEVSNDSTYSKSCLENVKVLKSQYEQLLKRFEKSELMVVAYKTGLQSVEERLEFYKKNESVYVEKINGLKWDIQVGEITIGELRKKLEIVQKEKDGIHSTSPNKKFMPPKPDLSFTGLEEFTNKPVVIKPVVENSEAKASEAKPKAVRKNNGAPIIEDWVSDSEEEDVTQPKIEKKTAKPSFVKIDFVDCNYQRVVKPVWNNANRVNYENFAKKSHPYAKNNMVPRAVLMKSELVSINTARQNISKTEVLVNTARQVNTAHTKTTVNAARSMLHLSKIAHSTIKRPIHKNTAFKNSNFNQRVNTVRDKNINTARPKTVVNVVQGNNVNAVKASACWVWKPKTKVLDHGNPQMDLQEKGVIDSGCSRHIIGNMFYLTDYEEIDGGYVAFGGNTKGRKITGKVKLVNEVVKVGYGVKVSLMREMNQFCEIKGILRQFSVARTPQQNGVAERRNRTLIEAARTMLADSKLPTTFWAEAVNTACYVQNRVLVVKPHNKTPYELFHGRTPTLSFMRPFGCPVTILNTIDHLGKFDGKADEGFFVGYSLNSKAFRVFNSRTRIVEENLHIRFSESTPNVVGSGPDWLFDIDALTRTMNYEPIVADYILLPLWTADPPFSQDPKTSQDDGFKPSSDVEKKVDEDLRKDIECNDQEKEDNVNRTNNVNATGINKDNAELLVDPNMPALEDYSIFDLSSDDQDNDVKADMNNLNTTIQVNHNPTTRIHKDHPLDQVIGDLQSATQTRNMSKNLEEYGKNPKRIEAIRLFLAYASFKDFVVYQMDVKSAFLYGKIEEEVSMIGSLMYLTSSRPDIMFAVCACARYQVNPKVSHLHAVKRIYRYLKGQPKLSLWYPKDSPFDLVAYSDSDYAGASLDRKSTTGGCQFLKCRLISWQCKKQTVVANSITEAEYVAASS